MVFAKISRTSCSESGEGILLAKLPAPALAHRHCRTGFNWIPVWGFQEWPYPQCCSLVLTYITNGDKFCTSWETLMFGADVSFLHDSKLNSTNEKIVWLILGLRFNCCFFFFFNIFCGPLGAVCSMILASPVRFLHLSLNLFLFSFVSSCTCFFSSFLIFIWEFLVNIWKYFHLKQQTVESLSPPPTMSLPLSVCSHTVIIVIYNGEISRPWNELVSATSNPEEDRRTGGGRAAARPPPPIGSRFFLHYLLIISL